MTKIFLLILTIFFVNGCEKQNNIQVWEEAKDSSKIIPNKKDSIVNNDFNENNFEGVYIFNSHINSFQDCNSPDSVYWVNDKTNKLKDLYKKNYPFNNVYGSVYAKLKGEILTTSDESIKNKFNSTLVVKEVIAIERKNFRNTCVPYDFWGLGNEPGWSLQISEKEKLIEFYLPSENKIYYFEYIEPKDESGNIVYETHNNIQRYVIKIVISKQVCPDTMSDNIYDYSVEVELSGGKKYKGCGIKGK